MFSRLLWRFSPVMAYHEMERRNLENPQNQQNQQNPQNQQNQQNQQNPQNQQSDEQWIIENMSKQEPAIPRRLTVTLVRHGETDLNRQHRIQGWVDVPLSEVGMKQAKELGYSLRKQVFDMAYSSDLIRAVQTLEQIQNQTMGYKTSPIQDDRLRERSFGVAENSSIHQFRAIAIQKMGGVEREYLYTPQGGETNETFGGRIRDFLVDLFQMIDEDEGEVEFIVIVTHGLWILTLMNYLVEKPDLFILENFDASLAKVSPRNTSIAKFDIYAKESSGKRVIKFSEINNYQHLTQPPIPSYSDQAINSNEPKAGSCCENYGCCWAL